MKKNIREKATRQSKINRAFQNPKPSNNCSRHGIDSDEFEPFGINENDTVFIQPVAEYDENKLGMFKTPRGLQLAFAYENFDDITLHLRGEEDQIYRYPQSKVTFLGVVIGKEIGFSVEVQEMK